MVAAWSACAARFRKQKGILGWLSVPRQMEERERRLFDLTTEKVEAWSVKAGLPSVDGFVVNEHLATLFSRASLLLDAEIAPAWPLIMDATRYALMGYLPVDFTVEDNLARVVLF